MTGRSPLALLAVLGAVAWTSRARALDGAAGAAVEVSSDTATQFYDVRSPTGVPVLIRSRLTTTLGVAVYDLLDRPKEAGQEKKPDLFFRGRLRYDADYGAAAEEATAGVMDRWVPGFSRGPVDLMYAYVEGRRFVNGLIGFRLGRQYVTDAMGWWSFDGGEVKLTTPAFLALEAYGGLEVRGGLPLSGALGRWEADGVWRGDRSGFDPSSYPSFMQADVAPAFGVALETAGVSWLHGRLSYRRVYNTNDSIVSQFQNGDLSPITYSGTRVSQEKLGYSLNANAPGVGGLSGGLVYDFYANTLTSLFATADVYLGKKITASVDYDFYQPTFDADSIWNFFAIYPMNDVGARVLWDATAKWSFSAGGHVRVLQNAATPDPSTQANGRLPLDNFNVTPTSYNGGGSLGARFRRRDTTLSINASGNFGDQGERVGGDVFGERVVDTHYVLSARLGYWYWEDNLRQSRVPTGGSLGYVLGAGYRFFHNSQVGIEWENDINALVGLRIRLLAYLSLAVTR